MIQALYDRRGPASGVRAFKIILLAEDPKIGSRSVYHAIWEAVVGGARTPTQIASLLGMDTSSLTYYLNVMRDGGFLRHDQDLLLQRRPVITIADPVVKFHNLVVKPSLLDFEMRNTQVAWQRSQATFSAKIEGPHFESLPATGPAATRPRQAWTTSGRWTVVSCREHRGHEVDVIALGRGSLPRRAGADIALLGEAKYTSTPLGLQDLHRLEHIAALLTARGWNTAATAYALFSRGGFTAELAAAASDSRICLLGLGELYRAG